MGIDLIFRIAGIGMLVAVMVQLLKQSGREDMATLAALAGLIIALLLVIDQIGTLFENVRRIFNLY